MLTVFSSWPPDRMWAEYIEKKSAQSGHVRAFDNDMSALGS